MTARVISAGLLLGAFCALAACAGGQSGSESPIGGTPPDPGGGAGGDATGGPAGLQGCEIVDQVPIDRDAVTPMGFTPRQVLDLAVGTQRSVLDFSASTEAGDTTELSVTTTDAGDPVRLIDVEPTDADPDASCPDFVEIDVAGRFTTDDGRFDESYAAELVAFQGNETGYVVGLDADALTGSFDYATVDNGDYATRTIIISARFDADGTRGRLTGVGTAADGSQTSRVVADWPATSGKALPAITDRGDAPAGDDR